MDAANNKVVEVFDTEEDCQCLLRNTQQVYRTSLTKERGSFTVVLSGVSLVKSLRYLVFVTVKFDRFFFFWIGNDGFVFFVVVGFRKLVEPP
jgi:6-phosphogluconolactonase